MSMTEGNDTGLARAGIFYRADLWAQRFAEVHQGIFILWCPVAFAAGIGLYFSLTFEPPGTLTAAVLFLLLPLMTWLFPLRVCGGVAGAAIHCLLLVSLCAGGFGLAQWRTHTLAAPVLERAIGPVDVTGTIIRIEPLESGRGLRLLLAELEIERLAPDETPKKVRIRVREDTNLALGQRISVLAGLNPPSAPVAPYGFDFQRFAWFHQIGAFGFAYHEAEIVKDSAHNSFWRLSADVRYRVTERLKSHVAENEASIAIALMTGQRSAIGEDDITAIRDAGLAHMLAISGLHIGLVAGFVFFAVRAGLALWPAFALRWPVKKLAALLALMAAAFFVFVVGPHVPALRALMMTGIVLVAVALDRVAISLRLVAFAAIAILAFIPESLMGASFQMSFAAVMALVLFYERTRPWWSQWHRKAGIGRRIALYLMGIGATSLIAGLATAPFSLYHFQHFALYGLLANLLAMPILSFIIMPGAVLAYIGMPLGLDWIGFRIMELGIRYVSMIAHDVAAMPHATWHMPVWPAASFGLLVISTLMAVLLRGGIRMVALVPLFFCVVMWLAYRPPDILISSSGRLAAVYTEDGNLALSSRQYERFVSDNWMRMYGLEKVTPMRWQREGTDIDNDLSCDSYGCRMRRGDINIAISKHEFAQAEDCAWADIIIAMRPLRHRPCQAPLQLDYFDFWRNGGHAVWVDGRVINVADVRGQRPWTTSNRR